MFGPEYPDDLSPDDPKFDYNTNDIWDALQVIPSDTNVELIEDLNYPRRQKYEPKIPNYYTVERDTQDLDDKLEKALVYRKLLDEIEEAVKDEPNVWLKNVDPNGKSRENNLKSCWKCYLKIQL